jgi:hypothetical protein
MCAKVWRNGEMAEAASGDSRGDALSRLIEHNPIGGNCSSREYPRWTPRFRRASLSSSNPSGASPPAFVLALCGRVSSHAEWVFGHPSWNVMRALVLLRILPEFRVGLPA